VVVHEHEHVLITLSMRTLEGAHDVAVYEPSDMGRFVPAALVRDMSRVSLSAMGTREVVHLAEARRSIGGEVR